METDPIRQSDRFARFCSDVLDTAVFTDASPLSVEAFQTEHPIAPADAARAPFAPVSIGWEWGPAWSTTWFRLRAATPPHSAARATVLRFDTGVEAQLWHDGVPIQGFDVNRDAALIDLRAGEPPEFLVEAACNHPFGVGHFPWDPADSVRRWSGHKPARLVRAELALFDEPVWRLATAYRFALLLLRELPPDSPRAQQLIAALSEATRATDDRRVSASAPAALDIVLRTLRSPAPGSATICHATGHAHIDTAWLWPIRETRRKCIRSFSNVLRLMDRFPDFRFLCSQAQQYAFIEQDAPALFDQIARRVREGRWEPGGAMWVEPDANCPSGESLVRQILHGTRYWLEKFGQAATQRFVYLPDTFGFPASLPQIIAAAGLDTFITNKLAWNPVNHYPHTSFLWRGIDGTEILTHFTPGADYNAVNTPLELRRGEKRHASKHQHGAETAARWLQPFGYGDGGGGPTDRSIHYSLLAADCDGLPRTRLSRADDFCDALHRDFDALRARNERPPVWDGELYLDLHRATLTTQAWLKRANRRAEELLRLAEFLSIASPGAGLQHADPRDRSTLDRAWKLLLLNQFHDILPGSSIQWVYNDAKRDHDTIRTLAEPIARAGLDRIAHALGGPVVLNPCSTARSGVVDTSGALRWVADVPALGARALADPAAPIEPVRTTGGRTLSNGLIAAAIDDDGRLASLRHLPTGRDALRTHPANRLALYEDRPRMWDAWDIDPEAESKPLDQIGTPDSIEVVQQHELRCAIRVVRSIGERSSIEQTYTLDAGSPRLDIRSRVDWREDHRLLRALFPLDVRSTRATFEIQFGHVERPTHRNTPWDRAKFEVCAHRWVDLAEPGFGVALLNDCKYGHSCDGNVLGLTLLRAPTWPDPDADRAEHEFTYSLMPHAGDWRAAGVDREAEALNTPLVVHEPPGPRAASPQAHHAWTPLEIESAGPASCTLAALKPAEDGDGAILRLVETHGARGRITIRWHADIESVERIDLLEHPIAAADPAFEHGRAARRTSLDVRPFEIISLRIR